jgi:hypothetical protein
MAPTCNAAFKEWAVVVDALGGGEQILILRKGGIHEQRGEFRVEHRQFWLYPTQFHEAEQSVIPSKRPTVREIAATAPPDAVDIQFWAEISAVHHLTDLTAWKRLQGRHIWSENILQQRFEFGREHGLHALVVRVFRALMPVRLPIRAEYGGCKSWLELERALSAENLQPVLAETEFQKQNTEIVELLATDAHAYA